MNTKQEADEELGTGVPQYEKYEEKMDELNEGLLEAYAAGFSEAVSTFDIDAEFSTDVATLQQNEALRVNHYYYWEGRTKPLQFWLQDQYGVGMEDDDE